MQQCLADWTKVSKKRRKPKPANTNGPSPKRRRVASSSSASSSASSTPASSTPASSPDNNSSENPMYISSDDESDDEDCERHCQRPSTSRGAIVWKRSTPFPEATRSEKTVLSTEDKQNGHPTSPENAEAISALTEQVRKLQKEVAKLKEERQ